MTRSRPVTENGDAKPTPIDAHVGNRIRLRRMVLGLPMKKVAKNLGVSWQQLGKYERATDRASASMLYLIASTLGVTVDFFFAEVQSNETNRPLDDQLQTADIPDLLMRDPRRQHISQLIASYWRIEDAKKRRRVLGLIRALADQADAPKLHTQPRRAKLT